MPPNKYKLNELLNIYLDLYRADIKFRIGFLPGEVIMSEYISQIEEQITDRYEKYRQKSIQLLQTNN